MGGLLALKKGRAHLAGVHLFDPETGQYNLPYVRRILGEMTVHVIHLILRQQGLFLAPGNPKGIHSLEDLARKDVVFVNRQKGSGTRMLLDYLLQERAIETRIIQGYGREEFTHMAVAACVLSQSADVGMGAYSAARALGLDFVPITMEQYDLVIPDCFFQDRKIQALLQVIHCDDFKQAVRNLGGYDVSRTGEELVSHPAGRQATTRGIPVLRRE
jgi:putative molybdopterin biosynthesis protein